MDEKKYAKLKGDEKLEHIIFKRLFKKSAKNSCRISSLACFSAPHVSTPYAPVLEGYAASTYSALFMLLFEHAL
ncbi:hypothetical protein [Paenisporosarcina sp. TG20]|uniref:hypothetical protein n=1 Tax=Paenisporosarcina sp. TG20 TaxID=1211706 RepID=UPI001ED95A5D|nr:hypothetical protein [Paenisporosarcina sp. TG20]